MRDRDKPAYESTIWHTEKRISEMPGLTKRQAAAIELTGSAFRTLGVSYSYAERAEIAVKQTDALFDELEKTAAPAETDVP